MVFLVLMMKKVGKADKYNGFQCFFMKKAGKAEKYKGFHGFYHGITSDVQYDII